MFYEKITDADLIEFYKRLGFEVVSAKIENKPVFHNRYFVVKIKQKNKFFKKKVTGFINNMGLKLYDDKGSIQNYQYAEEWSLFMLEKFGEEYLNYHETKTKELILLAQQGSTKTPELVKSALDKISNLKQTHQKLVDAYAKMQEKQAETTL